MFNIKSILVILVLGLVFSLGFNLTHSEDANAQCATQTVVIDAEAGTCVVHDFTGAVVSEVGNANCAVAGRNGERINCTCHAVSTLPRNDSLFRAEGFTCCIENLCEPAIVTNDTSGVESQGGIFNVTCNALLEVM